MVSQKLIKILFFFTVAVLSRTSLTVWSGTFIDDFSDHKPDRWKEVSIKWKIKDGGYYGVNPNRVEEVALIGDPK